MKKIVRNLTLTCLALAVMSGAAFGQTIVPVYDLGTNVSGVHIPPTPGILDITNFSSGPDVALIDNPAIGNVGPEHINYYGDAGNGSISAGETFVTPASYCLLQSVAFQMGSDNGLGGTGPGIFWLRIYQLTNANTAVLLAAYQCSNTFSFNANDWIQWTNLTVPLNPSSTYAYAFSRDPATTRLHERLCLHWRKREFYANFGLGTMPITNQWLLKQQRHRIRSHCRRHK
jgi:hypothetical protein